MKKLTSMLLCLVLLLTLAVPALAAEAAHMEANAVVDPDSAAVTVVVRAKQSTANARLELAFDPDYLTCPEIEAAMAVVTTDEQDGSLTIGMAAASADALKTGDVLAEISFAITGAWDRTALTVAMTACNGTALSETVKLEVKGSGYRFADVKAGQWFYEAVDAMAEAGYIKGMSPTHFGPNSNIIRADFVTLLGRMENVTEAPTETGFTDVKPTSYYAAHVNWAAKNGIARGIGNNLFAPKEELLREQMVLFLHRYAAYLGMDITPKDVTVLAPYADSLSLKGESMDAFAWAVENGIINGMDGKLMPKETATRAQVAVMLYRFFLAKDL